MTVQDTGRLVWLFARQERLLTIRSRWAPMFAVVFAVLALGVGASGYVLTGGYGMQDFGRTAASLVQLVLLLVPLAALVIGTLALSPDPGAAELLFSQPVPRTIVLAGKLLGLFEALAAAQLVGFGAAGVVIFSHAGDEGLGSFVLLVAGALVLTAVFLGIAALVASGAPGRRARSLAVALVVWFALVVLYDVGALGIASLLGSRSASRLLVTAALVNPVDAVRTGTLLGVEGDAAFGAASLAFFRATGGREAAVAWLCASLGIWLVWPALLAGRRLTRADL